MKQRAVPRPFIATADTSQSAHDISERTQQDDVFSPLSPISPWPPEPLASETSSTTRLSLPSDTSPTAKEVYGSIAILATYIAGVLYLVWTFAPIGWLDQWGWTWYPDREWAIIVPCYLMFIIWFTYWTYSALVAYNTPNFDSPHLITDPFARIPPRKPDEDPYYWKFVDEGAIPEAIDLPIDLVNRVLYPARPLTREGDALHRE